MLTSKQQRFVDEYLIDRNATQAAIRAGSKAINPRQAGHEFLTNPDVEKAIREAIERQSARTQIDADRVLREISRQAFYDPRDLADIKSPADIAALPENVRRAIASWGYDRHGNFMFKTADRLRALDMLARHLSLYNDKVQVNMLDGLAERLDRAKARIDALPVDDDAARQAVEGDGDDA